MKTIFFFLQNIIYIYTIGYKVTSIINSSYYATLINNNMARVSLIQSHNAMRLIFVNLQKWRNRGRGLFSKLKWASCLDTSFTNLYHPQNPGLTPYHTIPTFNDPRKETLRKHYGKRRKCL